MDIGSHGRVCGHGKMKMFSKEADGVKLSGRDPNCGWNISELMRTVAR